MTYPRHIQVSLKATPYYHCVARCVRRAWLWGCDTYAGKDYAHRKDWVLERLATLAEVFAIDVAGFAIMSNHYHLVLFVDRKQADAWSAEEVVNRWTRLFGAPELIRRLQVGAATEPEREAAHELISRWRARLRELRAAFRRATGEGQGVRVPLLPFRDATLPIRERIPFGPSDYAGGTDKRPIVKIKS